jgi:effector-binding domain-containing protein
MTHQIEVKGLQPRPTLSIRTTTTPAELGSTLGQLLPEVWRYLEGQGIQPAAPPFARYHGYGADRVDLEAGLAVTAPAPGAGRIAAGELPGGQAATTWHVGPYDTLPTAHHALEAWIKDAGREPAGGPWEVYWTDPGEEPDPAKWRTEVVWPIR